MKIWLLLILLLFTMPCWAHRGRHAHKHTHSRTHAHASKHGRMHSYAHHKHGHKKAHHQPVADAATSQFEQNKGKLLMPVEGALDAAYNRPKPQNFRGELNYGVNIPAALTPACIQCSMVLCHLCSPPQVAATILLLCSTANIIQFIMVLPIVLVSKGQHVTPQDRIGYVAENEDDCISSLNFQIWKAEAKGLKSKLDPEDWLRR